MSRQRTHRLSRRQALRLSAAMVVAVGASSLLAACQPAAPAPTAAPAKPTEAPKPAAPAKPTEAPKPAAAAKPTEAPKPAAAAPTPAPAAKPAPSGPVTIKYWGATVGPQFTPVLKAAIQDFEQSHPSIKVELEELPTTDLRTKLLPLFTNGGPGPDIVREGAVQTFSYAKLPYGFMDLSERVKAAGLKEKTPPSAWYPMEDSSGIYGLPTNAFVYFVIYNQELYDAAGIKAFPEDWDGFEQVVKQTTDPGKGNFGFLTYTGVFVSWPLEAFWYNSGVGYFAGSEDWKSFDVTKPMTFNSEKGVAALEYFKRLAEYAPGGIQGNIGRTTAQVDDQFAQGNIANIYTHSIHVPQIVDKNPKMVPGQNLKVALFPKGSARQGAMFSTSAFGISKASQNPDAAWEFLQFISDKWEGRLAPTIGTTPVRMDAPVDQNAPGAWLLEPGRRAMAMPTAHPQAFFPQLDAIRQPLGKNVEAFFLGQKSAKQALDDTVSEAADKLKA